MEMYKTYKTPLGYDVKDGKIDSYGVNHQNFSLRDELEYQYERQRRENKIIQGYNNQGITNNYPPQGTGFWGQSPDNNYGFGDSNIASAVETIKRNPLPTMLPETNNNSTWQNIKDIGSLAADTVRYMPEAVGELVADIAIAKDYHSQMNSAGKQLVNTYGSGQGANIDDYYHPLLQCQLAKISPTSKDFGLRLGYAKEILDYHNKKGTMPHNEIINDIRKDLKNNLYGSKMGYYNPNKSCWELLDDLRTENMRKENIR